MAGAEFMEGWAFWGRAKGRAWEGQQGRGIARVTGSEAQDLTTSPSSQLRSGLEKSKAPNGFLVLTELQDSAWPQCTARPESRVLLHPKPLTACGCCLSPGNSEGHQWAQGAGGRQNTGG